MAILQTSFDHTTDSASISQIQTPAQLQPSVFAEDSKPIPMPRAELKDILEVDDAIATSHSKSICIAYAKHNACNAAIRFYDTVVAEGRWPKQYQGVTVTEIRQLFISKTVWHSLYVPCFQDITKYDDMVAVEGAHTCADESMSVLTTTYLVNVNRTTKVVVLGKRSLIGKDELQRFIYSVKRSLNV